MIHHIVITGSRTWTRDNVIYNRLSLLTPHKSEYVIVHGDCKQGADAIADRIARQLGFRVIPEPANWTKYGISAGLRRNILMLEKYKPILVLAFLMHPETRGTAHCITEATKRNIPVQIAHGGKLMRRVK